MTVYFSWDCCAEVCGPDLSTVQSTPDLSMYVPVLYVCRWYVCITFVTEGLMCYGVLCGRHYAPLALSSVYALDMKFVMSTSVRFVSTG